MKRSRLIIPAMALGLLIPAAPAIIKPAKDWAAHEQILMASFLPGMMPSWNRASAGAFLPSDIASLWSWIDPAVNSFQNINGTTAATANDDPLGYLTDRSGNGRHWIAAANDTTRPLLKTNVINGEPTLYFSGFGLQSIFCNTSLAALTAAELFVVIKKNAETPSGDDAGAWHLGTDSSQDHIPYTDNNIYCGVFSTSRKSCGNPTPTLADFRLYDIWSASSDWAFEIDGSAFYSTATNTFGGQSAPILGKHSGSILCLSAQVAEFLIYGEKLSAGNRTSVKSYIADKYSLTIS